MNMNLLILFLWKALHLLYYDTGSEQLENGLFSKENE